VAHAMIHARRLGVLLVFWIAWPCTFATAGEDEKDTAATLRALDGNVWPREGEKSGFRPVYRPAPDHSAL